MAILPLQPFYYRTISKWIRGQVTTHDPLNRVLHPASPMPCTHPFISLQHRMAHTISITLLSLSLPCNLVLCQSYFFLLDHSLPPCPPPPFLHILYSVNPASSPPNPACLNLIHENVNSLQGKEGRQGKRKRPCPSAITAAAL